MPDPTAPERHEPLLNATCRAEHCEPGEATHVCRWLSHADAVHICGCGFRWETSFEDRVLAGFAPAFVQALQGRPTAPVTAESAAPDLSDVDWSQAVVCYTRCWSCQFDCHFDPPKAHTWMDDEDAEHAGHPWPLPPEIAAAKPCACPCAKPKEADRA